MFNLIPFLKNYIYNDQNIDKFSLIELSNNLPSSTFKKKTHKNILKSMQNYVHINSHQK